MALEQKIIEDLQGEPIKTHHSVVGHAVYLSIHPGRLFLLPFRHWFNKRYLGKYKFERAVFSFDLFLIGCVITLASTLFFFILFPFKQFHDNIQFIATVAPHEIVTGASSTLVIDYQNNTKETLRHPKLDLTFPNHFLLQSISYNGTNVPDKNISLADIPVGGSGTIHIQGVMFGDVGGTQSFGSTLTFVHGINKEIIDHKTATYTFSPAHSTLSLNLTLPNRAIASQPFTGIITYKNTGVIDFPEVLIKPEWPEGFTFKDATAQIRNGAFVLPKINAGKSGQIIFDGTLTTVPDQLEFIFHPTFTFGKDRYTQEVLKQSVPIMPAQLTLTQTVDTNILTPGTDATFRVHYKHIGKEPLNHIEVSIISKNPYINRQKIGIKTIDSLKPGDEGDLTFTVPIVSFVPTKDLTAFTNLQIQTKTNASYTLVSNPNEILTTTGPELLTKLTTPLTIESFARYTSPEGDQLGRGPLPPRVNQKTSYWIFWHIDGTTNAIKQARFEGTLPENVTFSGHQTSSEDGGVLYSAGSRKITWDISSIPATLDPQSQVFSVAFEVVLTPTASQIGTQAVLLQNIRFTGTDAFTGSALSIPPSNITTSLPSDKMAKGKGLVK